MTKFVVGKLYIGSTGAITWECLYTDEKGVLLRSRTSGVTGWYQHSAVEGMKLYEPPIIHKRKVGVYLYNGTVNFTCPMLESTAQGSLSKNIIDWIDIQYEEKRNG